MVGSVASGVNNEQHQDSMHGYKVLTVSFDTSFCF